VGGDIGSLHCRIAMNPISGQMDSPYMANHIGGNGIYVRSAVGNMRADPF
jgi:hypothetical protein